MKVLIHQLNSLWLNKETNLKRIDEVINQHDDIDFYFLPEMFNTGYVMQPEKYAETLDDSYTLKFLQKCLSGKKTIIGGSIPTIKDGNHYNTFAFVNEHQILAHYSKIHLFKPAGEGLQYLPGKELVQFKYNNIVIKPLICYDLRFPYVSFQNKEEKFDLLVYSANWPEVRINHWKNLLIARAIENQSFVIGINRLGNDGNGYNYCGNSLVVNYSGEVLMDCSENEVNIIEIDFTDMYQYRTKLNFLDDIVDIKGLN